MFLMFQSLDNFKFTSKKPWKGPIHP
jgi:hypothetical protein